VFGPPPRSLRWRAESLFTAYSPRWGMVRDRLPHRFIFGLGYQPLCTAAPQGVLSIDGPFSRPAFFATSRNRSAGAPHMTAHADIDHASRPHNGTAFFDCHGACVRAKTDRGLALISISGEIDASNVDEVSRRASEVATDCDALIVDLAEVDFIALDGLHPLFVLNMHCALTGKTWALIAGRAVTRLLRLVDRDRLLPAVGSATEALLRVRQSSRCPNRSLGYIRGQWHCISLVRPVKSPRARTEPARPSPGVNREAPSPAAHSRATLT
jgi:anti-anti-sigma regulatory factor